MTIKNTMSPAEQAQTKAEVDRINNKIIADNDGRVAKQTLGKDDFLQILITQMSHQDPTSPMKDTESIAQMAQFSSLEQMTNMSKDFSKLAVMMNSSEAVSTLGKTVEIVDGENIVSGVVEATVRGAEPQIKVNGKLYNMDQINTIYGN